MNALTKTMALAATLFAASTFAAERKPVDRNVGENTATPINRIKAAKDFQVELL